jgi:hypothetical protein
VFKVGDRVERLGSLVPPYMRNGVVLRVRPDTEGAGALTEYEVNFGNDFIATFYEAQLGLLKTDSPNSRENSAGLS